MASYLLFLLPWLGSPGRGIFVSFESLNSNSVIRVMQGEPGVLFFYFIFLFI